MLQSNFGHEEQSRIVQVLCCEPVKLADLADCISQHQELIVQVEAKCAELTDLLAEESTAREAWEEQLAATDYNVDRMREVFRQDSAMQVLIRRDTAVPNTGLTVRYGFQCQN